MFTVAFFLIYNGALAARVYARRRTPPPARLPTAALIAFGGRQVLFVAVLAATWVLGDWDAASVGIPASIRWLDTILAGELAFFGVVLAHLLMLFAIRRVGVTRRAATRGNLRAWPRGKAAKWAAALFIMVFNPFVEELVMRGVLIHHWGLLLGSPILPICVGLVLNAALHWYQGWRMQAWHALFFCAAVALLYSPWGLPAAMAAHVFGDVLPFLSLKRNLKAAQRARRRERREAATLPASSPNTTASPPRSTSCS